MQSTVDHRESDSVRTPSDPEKQGGVLAGSGKNEIFGPDPDAGLSEVEKAEIDRKLVRMLDIKLIPWLCLLYLMAFLDRTNIGNAKLDGLATDLHLDAAGTEYNISLTVFFISYSLFEPLTNVLLKRMRPSIFIPLIMVVWGIIMTCMGLVTNAAGLEATRFFLGLAEAGLFPGVIYYMSCWYKRSELGIRAAIFFSAAAVSGSFGGLLAAAISKMAGVGGKGGWAWIFILEGLVTIVFGIASYWMVHDFPDNATFLSAPDRARVIRRLKMDNQASAETEGFKMAYVWQALKDWKTWLGCVIYMGADCPLYSFALFLPTIISELGYQSTTAQLLSVPPYVGAALMTIFIGYTADRTRQRGLCNICTSLFGIIGFAMLLGGRTAAVQYAGTFLAALGIYPCIANTITWASNNIEGVYKRGVSLGIIIGCGNLNGVVSSNIYRAADKPRFMPGHSVVMGYLVLFLFGGSVLQYLLLRRENSLRLAGKRDHWAEGKTHEEKAMLGDKSPDFIYTL